MKYEKIDERDLSLAQALFNAVELDRHSLEACDALFALLQTPDASCLLHFWCEKPTAVQFLSIESTAAKLLYLQDPVWHHSDKIKKTWCRRMRCVLNCLVVCRHFINKLRVLVQTLVTWVC